MEVTDLTGNVVDDSVWFAGRRIARWMPSGNTDQYFFADVLGTNDVMTDAQGNVLHESDNYPFGTEVVVTDEAEHPYKFGGMDEEFETWLEHAQYRRYSRRLARWMSPDPAGLAAADLTNPQSLNRYAYVTNNPETLTDPEGLDPCDNLYYGHGKGQCLNGVNGVIAAATSFGPSSWDPFEVVTQAWIPPTQVGTTIGGVTTWGPITPGYWETNTLGNAFGLLSLFAAPVGPNGEPLPPPVALPPGANGQPNTWRPVDGTPDRPVKWVPQYPVPSPQGGQPGASWDDEFGHWDYDNGLGKRTRFDPSGNPINHPSSIVPTAVGVAAGATAISIILDILEYGGAAALAL